MTWQLSTRPPKRKSEAPSRLEIREGQGYAKPLLSRDGWRFQHFLPRANRLHFLFGRPRYVAWRHYFMQADPSVPPRVRLWLTFFAISPNERIEDEYNGLSLNMWRRIFSECDHDRQQSLRTCKRAGVTTHEALPTRAALPVSVDHWSQRDFQVT